MAEKKAKHHIFTPSSNAKSSKTAMAEVDPDDILDYKSLSEIGFSDQAISSSADLLGLLISVFTESSDGVSIVDNKGNFIKEV